MPVSTLARVGKIAERHDCGYDSCLLAPGEAGEYTGDARRCGVARSAEAPDQLTTRISLTPHMFAKFRALLGHTLIYGLGNYGVKVIGFLLIPVYTRYLTPNDYGIMALVSMYAQAMFVCMNLGQSVALFRFYYERDTQESRDRVVAAGIWIVFLFSAPLAVMPLLFSGRLARVFLGTDALWFLMCIGTGTVLAKVLLRMPFSIMRADNQSKRYASWSLVRNGLATSFAIALVVGFHLGATGVVLSQFLGEFIMCLLLTASTFRVLRAGFHWQDIKDQLLFGLPLVPAGAASFMLDLADRWFIKHYYSVGDVGIYSLGYRFAEILSFVVMAFQLSWPQFLFSHRKDPNAPQIYAQMTNYYLALLMLLWLSLSIFAPELLRIMAPPTYGGAAALVPVVAFAMALDGITFMVNIGPPFFKKTIFRTYTICTAAVVNLVLNVLLIPRYGSMGAAWATFGGFGVQVAMTLVISLRLYPVPYRYRRLGVVMGTALAIYALSVAFTVHGLLASIILKTALLTLYPAALLVGRFFEPAELAAGVAWAESRIPQAAPLLRRLTRSAGQAANEPARSDDGRLLSDPDQAPR